MADLYDPLTMPANLTRAHADLDRAFDACYRPKPFASDRERVEFLFTLYEKLTAPLTAASSNHGPGGGDVRITNDGYQSRCRENR